LAVAASILVIVSAAWWFIWNGSTRNEDLYSAYFSPDIGLPVAMGSADSTSYTFYDGMINYKEERYSEAISKWQAIANASGYTDTLRYYIGMALLNNKQEKEAESMLMQLTNMPASTYHDDAFWYLALVRLKNNDGATARLYLEKIKAGREDARELLSKIKP
jgi:predicted Zn-dependent protease